MKTIRGKIALLVAVAIAVSIAVVGFMSIATIVSKTDEDAASIITLTCQGEATRINASLAGIEDSVGVEVDYAESGIGSVERFLTDEGFRREYTDEMEQLFLSIAENTDGAISFYFRYNAETVESTQGFLYVRGGVDEPFVKTPLTDISLYDPLDDEHVGWYYKPLRNGGPTWLEPYQNKNLGIYMISYVVPVYVEGEFIGVIGMDVNFQVVINQIGSIQLYSDGFGFLVDETGHVLYHPTYEYGTLVEDKIDSGAIDFSRLLVEDDDGNVIVDYSIGGVRKKMAFEQLSNGMLLAITASESDIDQARNLLVGNIAIATAAITVIGAVVAMALGRRILRPLTALTEAAHTVAEGNLDVEIPEVKTAEVATLVDAYRVTVDRMREQYAVIEGLAHHDALTQLWNKTAYDERVARLDEAIAEGTADFAIVMVDVNYLKRMNDTYGHERGDEYLIAAVERIRATFADDDVYRVGGDEFVVVVEGDALADSTLDDRAATLMADVTNAAANAPWEHPSLAVGYARFDAGHDGSAIEVFERADEAMYAAKQSMKDTHDPWMTLPI